MLGAAVKVSVLIVVAVFFFAAAVYVLNSLYRAATHQVQIGKIPDLADHTDRAPYLLARAEELAKPVSLDALYEVKVPPLNTRFGAKSDLNYLDEVKVTIQGVNLPETIKSLLSAFPDFQTVVTTAPETVTNGSAARLELKEFFGQKKTWLLHSNKPPTDPEATREIIDQAIYQMVYYLRYDPNGPGFPPAGVRFPSERALQAYYSGQQRLSLYQRRLGSTPAEQKESQTDLDEAEKQFRILYQEMPNFTDGLMLLGLTLLEQKNEQEAIVVFERIQDNLIPRDKDPAKTRQQQRQEENAALLKLTPEKQKAFLSAKLFRAIAHRKLYRVEDNHEALAALEDIDVDVGQLHGILQPPDPFESDEQKVKRQDQLDFLKIQISALAEEAYVLGAYLVLLNPGNFVKSLNPTAPVKGQEPPPADVALNPGEPPDPADAGLKPEEFVAKLTDIEKNIKAGGDPTELAKASRLKEFRKQMENIYRLHKKIVKKAGGLIDELKKNENSNDEKTISERFRSDLNDAAGFAQFRHAQAVLEPEIGGEDAAFLNDCREALHSLGEAYAANQNEETILLNLGLIESDPRWDPDGRNIERARKYLKQAAAIKPGDYYALQLLATLGIRELYSWGALAKPEILPETVKAAEAARERRPGDGTILALLAQAYILQWQADSQHRKDIQAKIEMAIIQAEKRKATPVHLDTVRLQWLVMQAANSGDAELQKEDYGGQLATAIGKALGDANDDHSWHGRKLLKDAGALKQMLPLKAGAQSGLHWPY